MANPCDYNSTEYSDTKSLSYLWIKIRILKEVAVNSINDERESKWIEQYQ